MANLDKSLDEIIGSTGQRGGGGRRDGGGGRRGGRREEQSGSGPQRRGRESTQRFGDRNSPYARQPQMMACPPGINPDMFNQFLQFAAMQQQWQQQTGGQQQQIGSGAYAAQLQNLRGAGASTAQGNSGPQVPVSGNRSATGIAEDILAAFKDGNPVVLAGGVNAINQAVKGIAALRAQIQKESGGRKDITASASYRDEEKNSVSFIVSRCRGEAEPEFRELKVAGKSEIPSVAGSIAHGVRKGDEIALITMGPLACSSGIGAIILARGYLKKEDVAVSFRPAIVTIESGRADNEMVTALKLAVYSTESQK